MRIGARDPEELEPGALIQNLREVGAFMHQG